MIDHSAQAQRQAIREASRWYVRLHAEAASVHDLNAWQSWMEADASHRQAWAHIDAVSAQMARLPGELASRTFNDAGQSRRQVLRLSLWIASAGCAGVLGWRSDMGQRLTADYHTAVGERRLFTLADGSQLMLNTHSAVDLRFDHAQRLLVLRGGEIAVSTIADSAGRPFLVETPDGRVRALGTRFTVRRVATGSEVAVLEKAVEVSVPGAAMPTRVQAGERLRFTSASMGPRQLNDVSVGAWQQGSVIAVNQPLGDLLGELGRYRSGWLNCDPRIAGLEVSGAFPVNDTDRALKLLENSFPVKITRRTSYWVTVIPRA